MKIRFEIGCFVKENGKHKILNAVTTIFNIFTHIRKNNIFDLYFSKPLSFTVKIVNWIKLHVCRRKTKVCNRTTKISPAQTLFGNCKYGAIKVFDTRKE